MAGERIGKTYEAILKVVLDQLQADGLFEGDVFWNEIPEGISVEPDFIIGSDKDHPNVIVMVTHSGSSKNSDMKCWRNLGELCEAKSVLTPIPYAINIVFDSVMKENLKALQQAAFDYQLIIGDKAYGEPLAQWVIQKDEDMPVGQEEKVLLIKALLKSDKTLKRLLSYIQHDIMTFFPLRDTDVASLWTLERKRPHGKAPDAKNTFIRRGYTKRLLVGDALENGKIKSEDGPWLEKVGIVRKTISGYRITDSELLWFLDTPFAKEYESIAAPCMTDGFASQIKRVRSLALIGEYENYVVKNYDSLVTSEGMLACLRQQHTNPSAEISVPHNIQPPGNVWIYDFVAALSKAAAGRSQAFGYSFFSQHPLGRQSKVGNMLLGRWCTSFICEYFNRKPDFSLPDNAEIFVAEVLSEQLRQYSVETIVSLSNSISEKFVAKEYEAVLLAHRGFEPLLALLIHNQIVTGTDCKVNIRTCFSEKAGLSGQAGKTTVVKVKNTIINWQSATDAGKDHKRKELCGRAVGLRYSWDGVKKKFVPRSGVKKLILLLDGTWSQKDLNALVNAGWDEIYYPDELDNLKSAII